MKLALALLHMPQSKQSLWSTGEMEEQQGIQEPQYADNAGLLLPAKIKQIHFYTAQIQGITSTCNNWGDIFECYFHQRVIWRVCHGNLVLPPVVILQAFGILSRHQRGSMRIGSLA